MTPRRTRNLLIAFLLLLLPIAFLAMKYDAYQIDGDAMNYMDIADALRAHNWPAVINGYWHPLYPAFLALAQILFHPARYTELGAYYRINYLIFFLEVAAMWSFTTALVKLRNRTLTPAQTLRTGNPLLSLNALRFLGLALLLIATERELSMGKVRPDALLQALMLAAFSALISSLASESSAAALTSAALTGIFFGLAYLTKSFAFAVAFLSLLTMAAFGLLSLKHSFKRTAATGALAFIPFLLICAPWISALSHKYGHLDFGDSGALNFAWYSGDTEKMHLEPWMTNEFGTADVHLQHPEEQLLANPGIYSYRAVPYGHYPDWFDPSYFNAGVKPHIRLRPLLKRDLRNAVLVVRYLFNHPEGWLLFLGLLLLGGRLRPALTRGNLFAFPLILLGLIMWAMYGLVNIEERYVTLAYFAVLLPLFAMLRDPAFDPIPSPEPGSDRVLVAESKYSSEARRAAGQGLLAETWASTTATALIALLAFLALGETLRTALEIRRHNFARTPTWQDPQIFGMAHALNDLGIGHGDEIACVGTTACLYDPYWMRLADVRTTTEIYAPQATNLLEAWLDLPTRQQAIDTVRATGAKVLVAHFNHGEHANTTPEALGFRQLGDTDFYAFPLNTTFSSAVPTPIQPWVSHGATNQ